MFSKVNYPPINDVDNDKVDRIVSSILSNGWQGAPILYHESIGLITGSHRSVALERIFEMYDNDELTDEQMEIVEEIDYIGDYAYDVTDIVDRYLDAGNDIQFDYLSPVFEGTEIERWKDEIAEWY